MLKKWMVTNHLNNMRLIPTTAPACVLHMLGRSIWFADPTVIQRAKLAPANRLASFVSGPTFSKRTDIAATTLGHMIYFHGPHHFDPHSPGGLSLLAHEFKHVEQIERRGWFNFYLNYLFHYLRSGYGESMPQEAEAYEFGRVVYAHIQAEMSANAGRPFCLFADGEHRPNPDFIQIPLPFI